MSGNRPAANRTTLAMFKTRLVGAKKGHQLLKKKVDALTVKFRAMLKDIVRVKMQVAKNCMDGYFSTARANYAVGDLGTSVVPNVKVPAVTVSVKTENVAGVKLAVFDMNHDPRYDLSALGVAEGGQLIEQCRCTHLTLLENIIALASLQTAFQALDEAIKMTSRRVNALECVVIPVIEDVIQYIKTEMDEESREEFFRVKKVVQKKREREDAARVAKGQVGDPFLENEDFYQAPSALDGAKDDDIVF